MQPVLRIIAFAVFLVATCTYAWLRGGGPERVTAAALIVADLLSWLALSPVSTRFYHFETATFVIDAALFLTLFVTMLRANRDWPIAMCALSAVGVLGHLVKLVDMSLIRVVYQTMLQFWAWPMVLLLLVATRAHQRRLRMTGSDPSWRPRRDRGDDWRPPGRS